MTRIELFELLHSGLLKLNQPISRPLENTLIYYIELVERHNSMYKLTNIRDVDVMIIRHLLDSLSLRPYLTGKHVLDVGTGAGFPGIPLAITLPFHEFTLVETNQRKINFLRQVINQLRLSNVKIFHQRIEDYYPDRLFETVVSRTFGTLSEFLQQTKHTLQPQAQLLAMKGVYPLIEIGEIKPPFKLINVYPVNVPFLNAERHVVEVGYER